MAIKKEDPEVDSAAARCRPIELITENGFSIVRATELDGRRPLPAGKHEFVVCDADGNQLEITVEIDGKVVIEITLRSRGRISSQSSYWICCAERHLAEYLWEKDRYPPDEKLRVECLTLTDINLANRWDRLRANPYHENQMDEVNWADHDGGTERWQERSSGYS